MANCSENLYVIRYTDVAKGTISVVKSSLVTDVVDITLVGKTRKEYGEVFNENILHLLEGFAAPEASSDVTGNTPDLTMTFADLLANPAIGQRWFNSTRNRSQFFDGDGWVAMSNNSDVAAISGVIYTGTQLPRPMSADGYLYPYSECIWSVSPYGFYVDEILYLTFGEIDYMTCKTDATGLVTVEFTFVGNATVFGGLANFMIVGIKGNANLGTIDTP